MTISPNVSSPDLTVWDRECLRDLNERMTQLINQSIDDEGVHRTAPATPGLLITGAVAGPTLIQICKK